MKRAALATKKAPSAKRQKSQLAITQEIVRKELRKKMDFRYTDAYAAPTNVSSTGAVYSLLTNLVRGDAGKDNFQGNLITPHAITLRYFWTTQQTYNAVRLMVFQWYDASIPAVNGVIEDNATTLATLSPVLITNKQNIKVLYDETHVLAPTASGDTTVLGYGHSDGIKVYIPGKKMRPIRFNSTTNTVQEGNLLMLVISDDAVVSYPQLSYYSRVTFSDQ